jgi:glycosyltransferase involved in cell wall biosynthesis
VSESLVRVLVVSPPAPVWGAQIFLLSQLDALRERGVELTLATSRDCEFAVEWQSRGRPLVDLDIGRPEGLTVPGTTRRRGPSSLARTLREVVRTGRRVAEAAEPYDMLFSFSLASHPSVAVAGRIKGIPVALDLVDLVRPGVGRHVLRGSARIAQLTVANSQATADTVGGRAKVQIIQPGIDLERFHPGEPPEGLRQELTGGADTKLIGIVGRLDYRKGAHILVDAMARLPEALHNTRLVVVGETGTGPAEYAEELRATATEQLGDRVLFLGRRHDVPDLMRALDVLVVASASEPFGLTALEAQASRTPVIGTRAGGIPEFVVHEQTGLLVPPFDADALAGALERLLTDDELRMRLVDEAERRANPHRGLDAQYDALARMYRDVAGRAAR